MIGQLIDLIGGWRQVRASMGFSYQVARSGKRRIVPIEGYRKRGLADEQWLVTGTFADDGLSERFRDFSYVPRKRTAGARPPKRDFVLND
jgi:hypothetical protein